MTGFFREFNFSEQTCTANKAPLSRAAPLRLQRWPRTATAVNPAAKVRLCHPMP